MYSRTIFIKPPCKRIAEIVLKDNMAMLMGEYKSKPNFKINSLTPANAKSIQKAMPYKQKVRKNTVSALKSLLDIFCLFQLFEF